MTSERAWPSTGMTSDSPTLVKVVKERNNSSNHDCDPLPSYATNEPGQTTWAAT